MTNRQKEFCRHYANGLSAPKAAVAAGYATSTAERNAAHFLEHPAVYARICQLRLRHQVITHDDLELTRHKIMHVIEHIQDPELLLKASHELCRLVRMQQKIELDDYTNLKDEYNEALGKQANLQHSYTDIAEAQADENEELLHEIHSQLTDIEGEEIAEKNFEQPRHFDHTPDGRLAFDQPKAPMHRHQTSTQAISPSSPLRGEKRGPAGYEEAHLPQHLPMIQSSSPECIAKTDASPAEQPHFFSPRPRPWDTPLIPATA